MHRMVSYYIVLQSIPLHCVALNCIALHSIGSHRIALRCMALHCVVLHCMVLHCVFTRRSHFDKRRRQYVPATGQLKTDTRIPAVRIRADKTLTLFRCLSPKREQPKVWPPGQAAADITCQRPDSLKRARIQAVRIRADKT
jgi:hypothetical protein